MDRLIIDLRTGFVDEEIDFVLCAQMIIQSRSMNCCDGRANSLSIENLNRKPALSV